MHTLEIETTESEISIADEAYLLAASFYLHSWPQHWTARKLAYVLLSQEDDDDEDFKDQSQVKVWESINQQSQFEDRFDDVFSYADSLIHDLSESFIEFKNK